jgi:hypothetical protein
LIAVAVPVALAVASACVEEPASRRAAPPAAAAGPPSPRRPPAALLDASTLDGAPFDAAPDAFFDDPAATAKRTREELLSLFPAMPPVFTAQIDFLPGPHPNQGNPAVARRAIGRATCLAGLSGVVLQTDAQRATCGAENMVPVWDKGDASSAKFCIDVFEFPNRACELPIVWLTPVQAKQVCEAQGKRLCDQGEWNLACRADPAGGPDTLYAYGNTMDMGVCNTNKTRVGRPPCELASLDAMWRTCTTDSEPSGAFPNCRSRFGVYDQHGNVAEIMTRVDWDGFTFDQLKGSAFFYTDVAASPFHWKDRNTYPDHCNFDPRWHMEKINEASHFNYHLGFRCCKTIGPGAVPDGGGD